MAKNTLFLGMVNTVSEKPNGNPTKRILDFLWTETLKYHGMALLNSIDQVTNAYKIKANLLMDYTSFGATMTSWGNYKKYQKYLITDLKANDPEIKDDNLWPYIREFDHSYFSELSYTKNVYLIQILAVLQDYKQSRGITHAKPGPIYERLIKSRVKGSKLDIRFFEIALTVADYLENMSDSEKNQ